MNKLIPICIPSYKKGSNAKTLRWIRKNWDDRLDVYLFIYKDDVDNYKEIIEEGKINIIFCEGFRGIVDKRNFINSTMLNMNHDEIFVLDDDIYKTYILSPGYQVKDPTKYKSVKKELPPYDFFSTWLKQIYECPKHITQSGIAFDTAAWSYDLINKSIYNYYYTCYQICYFNIRDLYQHDIKYRKGVGWEDFDMCLQIYNAGLVNCVMRNLSYIVDIMVQYSGVNDITNNPDGWIKNSFELYKTWGDSVGFCIKKDGINARPLRQRILKKIEQNIRLDDVHYDDIYKEAVENNDYKLIQKIIYDKKNKK